MTEKNYNRQHNISAIQACYGEYVFLPISEYRRLVFDKLIMPLPGGKMADIGCGPIGWYWSLGYIHKATELDFYDINTAFLQRSLEGVYQLTPDWLHEEVSSTIDYLDNKGISARDIARSAAVLHCRGLIHNIHEKPLPKKVDSLLAIESIEIVDTEYELRTVIENCIDSLLPGGVFSFSVARFNSADETIIELQSQQLEGKLNPTLSQIEAIIENCAVSVEYVEQHTVPEKNYEEVILGVVRKK